MGAPGQREGRRWPAGVPSLDVGGGAGRRRGRAYRSAGSRATRGLRRHGGLAGQSAPARGGLPDEPPRVPRLEAAAVGAGAASLAAACHKQAQLQGAALGLLGCAIVFPSTEFAISLYGVEPDVVAIDNGIVPHSRHQR